MNKHLVIVRDQVVYSDENEARAHGVALHLANEDPDHTPLVAEVKHVALTKTEIKPAPWRDDDIKA